MKNTLHKLALAILASVGMLVATQAFAQTGYTNVIRNVSVALKVYQQYVPGGTSAEYGTPTWGGTNASDSKVLDHQSALTTKNIIAALGAVTGSNAVWTPNPQLVLVSTFSNFPGDIQVISNAPSTNGLTTNMGALELDFVPTTGDYGTSNAFLIYAGGVMLITNINGVLMASAVSGLVSNCCSGSFPAAVTNAGFVYNNTNDVATGPVPVSAIPGTWTTLTGVLTTNSGIVVTNIVVQVFTNYAVAANPLTNINGAQSSKMEVMYGGTKSPSFADVSSYFSFGIAGSVSNADGVLLGTTNPAIQITNVAKSSAVGLAVGSLHYFTTSSGSGANGFGTNLNLSFNGFGLTTLGVDTFSAKKGSNAAVATDIYGATSTAVVAGLGYTAGAYINATSISNNGLGNAVALPLSESAATGASLTGTTVSNGIITGALTNTIPIVVEGTITVGGLKNQDVP